MDLLIKKLVTLHKKSKDTKRFFDKNTIWLLLVGSLFILFAGLVIFWLSNDVLAPHWDHAHHLRFSLLYYEFLRTGEFTKFLFSHYAYYPPAVYQMTAVLYALLGRQESTVFFSMILWTWIAYGGLVYLVNLHLGRKIALLTGFLFLTTPLVFHMAHDFLLDIPLFAMIVLYLILLSKKPFESPYKAIMLGGIGAIGMLVKWTFVLYIAAPTCLLLASLLYTKQIKQSLTPILLFILAGCLLGGWWYGSHFFQLVHDFRHQVDFVAGQEGDPVAGTFDYNFYYLVVLCNDYIGLGLFLLSSAGLYYLAKMNRKIFILLCTIVVPAYVGITAISNKDPRYLFPLVPFSLIAVSWYLFQKKTVIRTVLLGGTILFCSIQLLGGVGIGSFPQEKIALSSPIHYIAWYDKQDPPIYFSQQSIMNLSRFGEINLYNPFSYIGKVPRKIDWKSDAIVKIINEKELSPKKLCLVSENLPFFNSDTLSYAYAKSGFMEPIDTIKRNEVPHCNILILRPSGLYSGDEKAMLIKDFTLLDDTTTLPDLTTVEVYSKG